MAARSFVLLSILCLLGASAQTSAPTSAPSSAPTSVPTAVPTSVPTSAPTSLPESSSAPTLAPDTATSTSNSTNPAPTPAPEMSNSSENGTGASDSVEHVTSFTATFNIGNASDFDQDAYLASVVATTGCTDASDVKIKSVTFVVSVSYSFADDITEGQLVEAVAANAGVEQSQVKATVTTVRRLLGAGVERRLAVTADVEISTTDASAADGFKAVANNVTALASKLSEVTGTTIAAPAITAAPAVAVMVETEVVSTSGAALSAPAAADLANEMSTRTGKTMTAEVTGVTMTERTVTTTTTTTVAESESSSASKLLAARALASAGLCAAVLLNMAF